MTTSDDGESSGFLIIKFLKNIHWLIWVMLALAATAVWFAYDFYSDTFPVRSESHEAWGQAGDFFGGMLGAGLAFLALMALLWSVHIQKEELRATRDILEQHTEELKASTQIMREQRDLIVKEDAKGTFMKLLEYASRVRDAVSTRSYYGDERGHGVKAFERHADTIALELGGSIYDPVDKEHVKQLVDGNLMLDGEGYGKYFWVVRGIIEFMKRTGLSTDPAFQTILQSSLSIHEIKCLHYYSMLEEGKQLGALAKEIGLFEGDGIWES